MFLFLSPLLSLGSSDRSHNVLTLCWVEMSMYESRHEPANGDVLPRWVPRQSASSLSLSNSLSLSTGIRWIPRHSLAPPRAQDAHFVWWVRVTERLLS